MEGPAAYTEPELARMGVEIVQYCLVKLRCTRCGGEWQPRVPACGRLPKRYWACPNGCNTGGAGQTQSS